MIMKVFQFLDKIVVNQTIEYNKKVNKTPNPTKSGMVFEGWYSNYIKKEKLVFFAY